MGKTRLVHELLSHGALHRQRKLLGSCHPISEPFPLGPVVEALRVVAQQPPVRPLSPLVGALRPLLPEIEALLPPQPGPLYDRRAERHRIFRALRELLASLGPTVCVFEDLHWAEDDTLEFLRFLLAEVPKELVVVVTYRREELDLAAAVIELAARCSERTGGAVALSPLAPEAVRLLVAGILGVDHVSEEFATHLHRRTGGLPFAIEEVVRLLQDRSELVWRDGGWTRLELDRLEVPWAVRDSVLARLLALSDDARFVTRAAALFGVPASQMTLSAMTALPPLRVRRALTEALSCVLLHEEAPGVYECRHPLAARSVYESIPAPDRRRLHMRAARVLEAQDAPPHLQLAHHFKGAGQSRPWARHTEAAADAAVVRGDDRAAARLYMEALAASTVPRAARLRIAPKLGPAALHGLIYAPAVNAIRRTLDEAQLAAGVRGRLRFDIARLLREQGETAASRGELEHAVAELRREPHVAARLMVNLAMPEDLASDIGIHLEWLDKAAVAGAARDDPALAASLGTWRAALLLYMGDPRAWTTVGEIPEPGCSPNQELELLRGYHHLAGAALVVGHYGHASAFLIKAEDIRAHLDLPRWRPWLGTVEAAIRLATGHWEGLEIEAQVLLDMTGDIPRRGLSNQILVGSLLLARGETQAAKNHLVPAMTTARGVGWLPALAASAAGLLRLSVSLGEHAEAVEMAAPIVDFVRSKGVWAWATPIAPSLVEALIGCDRIDDARRLVSDIERGLRGRDAPSARATLLVCQGLMVEARGDTLAASGLFGRAAHEWASLPGPYEAAQAAERRGRCLLAADNPVGGDVLRRCLEDFVSLGAHWDVARTRALLRRLGIGVGRRGGRRPYGNDLSPREEEVAQLVTAGRSNREIAAALFLSPRTVEDHVASTIRKLGLSSRKDIAVALTKDP